MPHFGETRHPITDDVQAERLGGAEFQTAQEFINTMHSPGGITGGELTEPVGGTIRVAAGSGMVRIADDDTSTLRFFSWPQTDFSLPADQDTRYFGVTVVAGVATVEMRSAFDWDKDTEIPLGSAVAFGGPAVITSNPFKTGDPVTNIIQRFDSDAIAARDNQVGGLIIAEGPGRTITVSAGKIWSRLSDFDQPAKDSAITGMLTVYSDGTDLVLGGSTTWDNTQYNTGGALVTMTDNRYAVLWFYMAIQSGTFGYAYGTGQYTDIPTASLEREPAYLPADFKAQSILIGRLIFRKGASTADSIVSAFDLNLPFPSGQTRINTFYDSSGLITGGALSINGGDNTKFDLAAGIAAFMDFSVPGQPAQSIVEFGPFTAQTTTHIGSAIVSYVGIDSTGAIVQQVSPFSNTQRRSIAFIGALVHSNLVNLNAINTIASTVHASANQLHDLMSAVGALNTAGNVPSANGANLSLNKSAGTIFKFGVNFQVDESDPHVVTLGALVAPTFRYRLSDGTEFADTTTIDPDNYEAPLGTLTNIPASNRFTIQRINLFQSNIIRIQYGQTPQQHGQNNNPTNQKNLRH